MVRTQRSSHPPTSGSRDVCSFGVVPTRWDTSLTFFVFFFFFSFSFPSATSSIFGSSPLFPFLVFLFLLSFLGISDLLFLRCLNVQLDGKANEIIVLLRKILQSTFLSELRVVFLQGENDLRASIDLTMDHLRAFLQGEGCARRRLPDVLFILVVLGIFVRNQMPQMKTNAKLSNHGVVAAGTHGHHESFGSRFGCRPNIVHGSAMFSMKKFGWASIFCGQVIHSYLTMSKALEEFEIITRRRISLLEWKVLMIRLINCWMSALNTKVSKLVLAVGS